MDKPNYMIKLFEEAIFRLIKKASTELPEDVLDELKKSEKNPIIENILLNCKLAKEKSVPICQDTGIPTFFISCPKGFCQKEFKIATINAIKLATAQNILRQNAVDPITQKNSGCGTGNYFPIFYFEEWENESIKIELLLKGGGCENVSSQYSLPNCDLDAGRDIDGIRKVILDSVWKAQGNGCAPGIIGICIGGDRATGHFLAKKQLLRKLNDVNENKIIYELEKKLMKEINTLGIGPMGLGGNTTALGVKIGSAHRVPASFFVTISYMCWACRRKTLIINNGGYQID